MPRSRVLAAVLTILPFGATTTLAATKPSHPAVRAAARRTAAVRPKADPPRFAPVTLDEARTTISVLDDAYQMMLQEIHHWYPSGTGRPVVAAAVMRQVQEQMSTKGWPPSHFLGVSGILMNQDHRPRDEFEKRAVEALRKGEERVEEVQNGRLRAATLVPLTSGCSSCHWTPAGQTPRAAISWSIPLKPQTARK